MKLRTASARALLSAVALLVAPAWARAEAKLELLAEGLYCCDASAVVRLDDKRYVVASDEDNTLRVYRFGGSGQPEQELDLDKFLQVDPKHPECDIEGAARAGNRTYWITSHGLNREGKLRPSRYRLWAVDLTLKGGQPQLAPVGVPYMNLLRDMTAAPALQKYDLAQAAQRAPEEEGGLNIEGLAAQVQGKNETLLIGLRNPLAGDRAIVIPLTNPLQVVKGQPAKFAAPIELDLGGRGIRGFEYWPARSTFTIVAGPASEKSAGFALYLWSGKATDAPERVAGLDFGDLHPESVIPGGNERELLIVCDDGSRRIGETACKSLDPPLRKFRTARITIDD